jgi:sulfur carrier protein ThiS
MPKITIVRVGKGTRTTEVPLGASFGQALEASGLSSEGAFLSINGQAATLDSTVKEGDVLTVNPKVQGGSIN